MYILLSFSQPVLSLNPILLKLFCNLGVQSLLTLIPSAFYDWIDICSIFSVTVSPLLCTLLFVFSYMKSIFLNRHSAFFVCVHWTSKNMVLTWFFFWIYYSASIESRILKWFGRASSTIVANISIDDIKHLDDFEVSFCVVQLVITYFY